jgi:drug/metabolite transporter (DMT)-like permease
MRFALAPVASSQALDVSGLPEITSARLPQRRVLRSPRPAAKTSAAADRPLLGVLALLVSTALFPMSDSAAKALTQALPPLEVAWLRYAVFVLMTGPLLLRGGHVLRTARPGLQIARGVTSGLATLLAILSFSFLPVADSTAIGFVAPVAVTALAALVLREAVGLRRWGACLAGLVGVIIIVQPGTGAFQPASLIPLVGSLVSATAILTTRIAKHEGADTTILYSALVGFVLLSIAAAFCWQTPTWPQVAIGGVVGFFATLASFAQLYAYRQAPTSLLAPFTYTQLIWAAALGYVVFGTVPGPAMLLGAAVIAASGAYMAWREARAHRAGASAA